jgi:hypothetical protein
MKPTRHELTRDGIKKINYSCVWQANVCYPFPHASGEGPPDESSRMSIAIIIGVHDGVVLAADSASTLTFTSAPGVAVPPGQQVVGNVYDNANKIFNLVKGQPIGCITFGSGNIGNASVGTLIKDLRKKLTDTPQEMEFAVEQYTMEGIAKILAKFLGSECDKLEESTKRNTNMGFFFWVAIRSREILVSPGL